MNAFTPTMRAAIWMLGAALSFSIIAVAGRELSARYDTYEMMFYRSLLGVMIVVGFAWHKGKLHEVGRKHFTVHLMRNIVHFIGQNLWLYAVALIPLSQLFALEFTTPLWVAVLAPILLSEALTKQRALCVAIGFLGVLMVARPSGAEFGIGQIAAISCAIAFALTAIFTKRLVRHVTVTSVLVYLTGMQTVLGLVCAGIDGQIMPPSLPHLPWLVALGLAGLSAHYCITHALTIAPASVAIPFDFARLPLIAIIGALLYNEGLELMVILGAVVIFAAGYLSIVAENRHNATSTPPTA